MRLLRPSPDWLVGRLWRPSVKREAARESRDVLESLGAMTGDEPSGVLAGVIAGVATAASVKFMLSRRELGLEPENDGRSTLSKYFRLGRSASRDRRMLGGLL